jgi:predicted ArsR family transcriptional regulator
MMDAVLTTLGPAAAHKVLAALADSRVSEIEPALRDLSLDDRVAALRNWYLPADPYMESEKTENGYRLVERNCPYLNTAMSRPALCSVTVNALTRLIGFQVRREQKFQHGDGRCVFRVFLDEPVDPASQDFQLESETERVTV